MSDIIFIILVAFGVSALTQLINKLLVNEKYVDEARERMKQLQKQMKEVKDIKSKEFTQAQDQMMDINFNIMKQQMKPMLLTFLPYLIVFWVMSATFAYLPFEVGSNATVKINGNAPVSIDCLGFDQTVAGHFEGAYAVSSTECSMNVGTTLVNLSLAGKKEIVTQEVAGLKVEIVPPERQFIPLPVNLPFIGDSLGWFGAFIISSLLSSVILGKALKGRYLRKWQ